MQNYFDNLSAAKIYEEKINSIENTHRRARIDQDNFGESFFSIYASHKAVGYYSDKPLFKVSLDTEYCEFIKKIEKIFQEVIDGKDSQL